MMYGNDVLPSFPFSRWRNWGVERWNQWQNQNLNLSASQAPVFLMWPLQSVNSTLLSPPAHFSRGPEALLLQPLPGRCLPQMKKRSVSGHAEANGLVGASGLTGASGQGACLPVPQGTPYPGTYHCMSRKSGKARILCWTLRSVLWSELLVRDARSKLGAVSAWGEWVGVPWLGGQRGDPTQVSLASQLESNLLPYYWKDDEVH